MTGLSGISTTCLPTGVTCDPVAPANQHGFFHIGCDGYRLSNTNTMDFE